MPKPPPPPEAQLIRLVREAAGIKTPAAARAARISKARWSQIETGYETRGRAVRPVRATPGTLAHMAAAVGMDPERLETEGQRPDAAAVLREMQRQPVNGPPAPVPTGIPDDDPVVDFVRHLPGLSPERRQQLEDVARSRIPDVNIRRGMVGFVLTMWQQQDQAQGQSA